MGRPKKETTKITGAKSTKTKTAGAKTAGAKTVKTKTAGCKEKIPAGVRTTVWNMYIGEDKGEGKCFVGCKERISQANFACGHVQAEACGGAVTIQNLRPICNRCNSSMGKQNMEEYMNKYGYKKCKNWNGINEHWWSKIPFL